MSHFPASLAPYTPYTGGRSVMTYQRPEALTPGGTLLSTPGGGLVKDAAAREEEIKTLRFLRHVSAFDVDIKGLEDHPWRNKAVDLFDYFNYGFNERTWLVSVSIIASYTAFSSLFRPTAPTVPLSYYSLLLPTTSYSLFIHSNTRKSNSGCEDSRG
jgi:hypothetical protein